MLVSNPFSDMVSETSVYQVLCADKGHINFYFKLNNKSIPIWEDKLLKRKTLQK